jgi:hypothetical protein
MGTNYYLKTRTNVCEHCGRADEESLHIGKSSMGWVFSLRFHPDEGIGSLEDWRKRFATPGAVIEDEYGDTLSPAEMLKRITERGRDESLWETKPYGYASWAQFHEQNGSERGPRGLLRARMGGPSSHLVGHGDGTWSIYTGEFS